MRRMVRLGIIGATTFCLCRTSMAQDEFDNLNGLNNLNNINNLNSNNVSKNSSNSEVTDVLDVDELNANQNLPPQENNASFSLNSDKDENLAGDDNQLELNNLNQLNQNNKNAKNLQNLPGNNLLDNLTLNPSNGNTTATPPPSNSANTKKNSASNVQTTQKPPLPSPPVNVAPGPGSDDVPPPPEATAAENAAQEATNTAANSQVPPPENSPTPAMLKAERRRLQLELVKKMAENIPALRPGEAPVEYVVQPGDTLWDVSEQLLDDALWWPRLWTLNPEVTDPDKLEPGMRLVFYPSTADNSPELLVQDVVDPFGSPKVDVAVLQTFKMDVANLMGPNGELISPDNVRSDPNLLVVGEPQFSSTYLFRLPGFFSSSEIPFDGEVISNPNSPLIAGQGQNLIARFDRSPAPGERFLVIRESPVIPLLDGPAISGVLYHNTGTVGVVRSTQNGYAVLVAEDKSSQIAPNDKLIPARRNLYVPLDQFAPGRPNPTPAFVVATENGQYQSAGPGNAIYLTSANGSQNAFQVGDDVELFMPLGSSPGMNDEVTPREKVALARIVDTTEEAAVGVILSANREVMIGASTFVNLLDE